MHKNVTQANSEKKEIRVLLSGVEPKIFKFGCSTTELQETRGGGWVRDHGYVQTGGGDG